MSKVITMGKFDPLHLGHVNLLNTAEIVAGIAGKVSVLVDSSHYCKYDIDSRTSWVKEQLKGVPHEIRRDSTYEEMSCNPSELTIDKETGLIKDDEFWEIFDKSFEDFIKTHDYVVTSDRYGEYVAKRYGLKWIPCDPNREVFYGLCATNLRKDLDFYWNYLSPAAKQDLARVVAVVGPEGAGKTTALEFYDNIPEYGALTSQYETAGDFVNIIDIQKNLIDSKKQLSSVVITDTECYTTLYLSQFYGSKGIFQDLMWLRNETKDLFYYCDHYLYMEDQGHGYGKNGRILTERQRKGFKPFLSNYCKLENFSHDRLEELT